MANTISLAGLNDKEIQALQDAINQQRRIKGPDYNNMNDEERQMANRTLTPITPTPPHIEYPKTVYGNINGDIQRTTIRNDDELARLRAKYPDAHWGRSLRDHGMETHPSIPEGIAEVGFVSMGRPQPQINVAIEPRNDPSPQPVLPRELSHGEKIRAGREKAKARREAA